MIVKPIPSAQAVKEVLGMYLCPICNTPYEPVPIKETSDLNGEGAFQTSTYYQCQICGYPCDPERDKADLCECCHFHYKLESENLCSKCRRALIEKFKAFADELTEPEEDTLDDLLDGCSVKDRVRW